MVASHVLLAELRARPLSTQAARLVKCRLRLSTDLHAPVDTMTDYRRYRDSAATSPLPNLAAISDTCFASRKLSPEFST
jgi:hypothetical protein